MALLVTVSDFQKQYPIFNTPLGGCFLAQVMRVLGLEALNRIYEPASFYKGVQFVEAFLGELSLQCSVSGLSHLQGLENKPFISVSNHPYGSIDGLLLVSLLGNFRPDYKVMVNQLLECVKPLSAQFIGVDPVQKTTSFASVAGLRLAMKQLQEGHPLGLFPAGAVSKFNARLQVQDRTWQPSVLRMIQRCNVSVLPFYFHGNNSFIYNLLGSLSWRIGTLRLPREVLNKRGKTICVTIGEPIELPEPLLQKSAVTALGEYLKRKTYALHANR